MHDLDGKFHIINPFFTNTNESKKIKTCEYFTELT